VGLLAVDVNGQRESVVAGHSAVFSCRRALTLLDGFGRFPRRLTAEEIPRRLLEG